MSTSREIVMPWIDKFRKEYLPLLDIRTSGAKRGLIEGMFHRSRGFSLMFDLLLENPGPYRIVETGTLRAIDAWKDGQSARLFTEFVDAYGGDVRSVDLDADACATARKLLPSNNFSVTCSDSVIWLESLTDLEQVDLFYLDSWDVKWRDDTPSARHHLREFQIIEPYLRAGSIVAIDDNSRRLTGQRTGKGRMIVEYLDNKNIKPIFDGYQIIYRF